MFQRVQLLKLLLYFGPPSLVSRLKRHLHEDVRKVGLRASHSLEI